MSIRFLISWVLFVFFIAWIIPVLLGTCRLDFLHDPPYEPTTIPSNSTSLSLSTNQEPSAGITNHTTEIIKTTEDGIPYELQNGDQGTYWHVFKDPIGLIYQKKKYKDGDILQATWEYHYDPYAHHVLFITITYPTEKNKDTVLYYYYSNTSQAPIEKVEQYHGVYLQERFLCSDEGAVLTYRRFSNQKLEEMIQYYQNDPLQGYPQIRWIYHKGTLQAKQVYERNTTPSHSTKDTTLIQHTFNRHDQKKPTKQN
jgi:hypothetical protein